ncbi:hypothetical protein CBR_g30061 [Chara braunii]|uniref:tRNA pseudouridine synthase n=1 Tax=Chara braunii TaxID=69332 RepID=A0A388LBW4_CHABU|nr:hypothetical protein CBR_g30061 [Chara braunii]|eukprot:GBG79799.1 hypothetical protein CBR_g30061 [Chara braunii]
MAPTVRSQRYLLTVEYIGSSFLGWQKQRTGRTVQGVLEEAFEKFVSQPVIISGSSRTDTGVHALGNTAHVEFERTSKRHPGEVLPPHDPTVVKRAVNHFLGQSRPQDVALVDVQCVPSTFHSRFAARERVYCYRMTSSSEPLSIFEQERTWHVPAPLDLQAMKEACALLEGHHDFSSFRASGCQANSPLRTLDELTVAEIPCWSLFTPALLKTAVVKSPKDQQQVLREGSCATEGKEETATRRQSPAASEGGKGIVLVPPVDGAEESWRWNTTELDSPEAKTKEEGGENGGGMLQANGTKEGRESAAGDSAAERKEQRECGEEGNALRAAVGSKRPGPLGEEVDEKERGTKRPNGQGRSPERLDVHRGSGPAGRTDGAEGSLPSSARWTGGPRNYVVVARARSFLYHQVRLMVGLIKAVGCGERSVADVKRILEARTPTAAPPMAPACGLYLAKVAYPVDERGFVVDVGHDNRPSQAEGLQDDSGDDD